MHEVPVNAGTLHIHSSLGTCMLMCTDVDYGLTKGARAKRKERIAKNERQRMQNLANATGRVSDVQLPKLPYMSPSTGVPVKLLFPRTSPDRTHFRINPRSGLSIIIFIFYFLGGPDETVVYMALLHDFVAPTSATHQRVHMRHRQLSLWLAPFPVPSLP
jgi:hypothetical protein